MRCKITIINQKHNGYSPDAQPQYDAIPTSIAPNTTDMKPGDLVFFSTYIVSKAITHVGIHIGNNQFLEASGSEGVVITSLSTQYYKDRLVGVQRVFTN